MIKKQFLKKCISAFITIFLLVGISSAKDLEKPHFSLILSGGGSRGLAQIGVIKALEEAHLTPDLIVATSMGSIIGSFYAAGYSSSFIKQLANEIDWTTVFSNAIKRNKIFVIKKDESANFLWELQFDDNLKPIIPNSLSYGQYIYNTVTPYLTSPQYYAKMDFDSMSIPIRIVATDILSGNKVVFSKGNIATAIRASCAIPLVFSPVEYEDMLLVDGGLSANIPVSTAKEIRDGLIVAVDVTSPLWKKSALENPVHFVDQIVSLDIKRQKEKDLQQADIIITPKLTDISNSNFSNIDSIIAAGYTAAKSVIPQLIDKLKSENISESDSVNILSNAQTSFCMQPVSRCMKFTSNPIQIKKISITGNKITRPKIINRASGIKINDSLTPEGISRVLNSVYSTNLFQNVNFDIDSTNNLRLTVEEKKYLRVRFGLRFDEFHLGEGFIQPAYENLFGAGICALIHLQYGLRREKYSIEFQANHLFSSDFANNILLQMYISKDRIFQREIVEGDQDLIVLHERLLRKNGLIAMVGTSLGKSAQFSTGFRIEEYKIQISNEDSIKGYTDLENTLPDFLLKLNIDSMDKYPFPTSGMRHSLIVNISGKNMLYKDPFVNISGSFGRNFTFRRIHTLSPKLQFSWASATLPQIDKSYLGGMIPEERSRELAVYNNIQFIGLKPRALSGDLMALLHLDYRIKIIKKLYSTFTVDWGDVWERNDLSCREIPQNFIKYAPVGLGIGLSYESIVGPIQISYGQTVKSLNRMGIRTQPLVYFSAGFDF